MLVNVTQWGGLGWWLLCWYQYVEARGVLSCAPISQILPISYHTTLCNRMSAMSMSDPTHVQQNALQRNMQESDWSVCLTLHSLPNHRIHVCILSSARNQFICKRMHTLAMQPYYSQRVPSQMYIIRAHSHAHIRTHTINQPLACSLLFGRWIAQGFEVVALRTGTGAREHH